MQNKPPLATLTVHLQDEADTIALAREFAPMLDGSLPAIGAAHRGGRIHLRGELGAGKTAFVRALLQAAGVTGRIKSPTYTLLETYKVFNLYFYHLDFYRFGEPREWLDAGFRDILQKEAVVLIEWPERAGEYLPSPDLEIRLEYADIGRQASLTAYSNKGKLWLTALTFPSTGSLQTERPDDGS